MSNKVQTVALVKPAISSSFSHIYIDFVQAEVDDVKKALAENDLPPFSYGNVYNNLVFNNQYGSGVENKDPIRPYGFTRYPEVFLQSAGLTEAEQTVKLCKKIIRRIDKLNEEKGVPNTYEQTVNRVFEAMNVKSVFVIRTPSSITGYPVTSGLEKISELNQEIINSYQ